MLVFLQFRQQFPGQPWRDVCRRRGLPAAWLLHRYGRRDNADHGTAEIGRAECTSSSSPPSCPIRRSAPRRRPARARPDRNAASTRPPGISRRRRRCRGRAAPAAGLDFLPDLSGTCTRRLLRITGGAGRQRRRPPARASCSPPWRSRCLLVCTWLAYRVFRGKVHPAEGYSGHD